MHGVAEDQADIAQRADDAKLYWHELAYSPGGVVKEADYDAYLTGLHPLL